MQHVIHKVRRQRVALSRKFLESNDKGSFENSFMFTGQWFDDEISQNMIISAG